MKTEGPESPISLSLALAISFSFVLLLSGRSAAKVEPTGTNMGVVQFDAVIELNRYSPGSLRHDHTMIFARYWVARDYYSASVVWAEPQSTDMFFAIRPPGLSVAMTLPWAELLVGVCLVGGIFVGGALLINIAMAAMFTFALASALYRGLDISCGCFSASSSENISYTTLIRACLVLLLSLLAYVAVVFLQSPADRSVRQKLSNGILDFV